MPPLIVNQAENYTQDLHWNLPSEWLFQNTLSGYMDRYGWMKAIILFSRTYVAIKLKPQVFFFDGHERHFNDRAINLLQSHQTSPFILKAGDSTNDQPNDNGSNLNVNRY